MKLNKRTIPEFLNINSFNQWNGKKKGSEMNNILMPDLKIK